MFETCCHRRLPAVYAWVLIDGPETTFPGGVEITMEGLHFRGQHIGDKTKGVQAESGSAKLTLAASIVRSMGNT